MTRELTLAVIPGDGIGREVTAEALKVLEAAIEGEGVELRLEPYTLGAEHYLETGELLHDATLERIAATDAILFGAVGGVPGDPRLEGVSIERSLLLRLRFAFDQYVNLRPAVIHAGATSLLGEQARADFVIVREGTEGAYSGSGGLIRQGTGHAIATEVSVNTAFGVERVVRYAFELARQRRRHLTVVHKNNVLVYSGALWADVQAAVSAEYPDVDVDYLHVDAATIHLLQRPESFDVIVTDNLFGDILTDLAGAITGGIGLAASGNIDPEHRFPSMFEPVHGSAPDIAGRGIADPTAAILSAGMLLDHVGLPEAGQRVRAAVAADIAARTAGARRPTVEVGDAMVHRLFSAAQPVV
jgi:3-isopropylmalate dehydrogenase